MTKTRVTSEDVQAARVAELAAMLDPLDIPGDWTPRQRDAYEARRVTLRGSIAGAEHAKARLAELDPQISAATKWRDDLNAWRERLSAQLLALPPTRDRALIEHAQGLTVSIRAIDHGCTYWPNGAPGLGGSLVAMIQDAGYTPAPGAAGVAWHGSLTGVEERLKVLTRKRDEAQAALADALLDDETRARRSAEAQARAANTPVRKTRADGSQYDKYPDGRRVEVEATQV
jgi:hypothetical protein